MRAGVGNMIKSIADVERDLVGQEIGDSESGHQDEVELAGLFRDFSGEIGPKGASGEFGIGSDSVKCDEGIFDFWGEANTVCEDWLLKLDIDHFGAERDLAPIPTVANGIGQCHHPVGHEGRALLLGRVVLCETMREQITCVESDFLSADGDPGRDFCGMHSGRSHERPESQCCEDPSKKWHAIPTSISCRQFYGES